MKKTIAALAVLFSLALTTACASENQPATHNDADVAFAQGMIPHHQQAVDMAKLVPTRSSDDRVKGLASRIEAAQAPEIQQMTGWLTAWGAPTSMGGMDHGSMPMPGMMGDADMSRLNAVSGTEFDRQWLTMMIAHHQGALDMANRELASGADPAAKALAKHIVDSQQAEITEMHTLLG